MLQRDEVMSLHKKYRKGMLIKHIANQYQVSENTIRNYFRRYGLHINGPGGPRLTASQREMIHVYRARGDSYRTIAEKVKCNVSTVYRELRLKA